MLVRDARPAEAGVVLALNNSAAPNVNVISLDVLERIVALASYYRVVEDADGIAAFVICLPSGVAYWSGNYRWFAERYAEFLYLDRVVVAARVRGQGVGAMLYDDMHAFAKPRWPRVALEVNLAPPNPGSVRFHERLGYVQVGARADGEQHEHVVAMYVREC